MSMPIYFRQILAICLTLSLQYPVSAQPTESAGEDFRFCMVTCISNSCSGPASALVPGHAVGPLGLVGAGRRCHGRWVRAVLGGRAGRQIRPTAGACCPNVGWCHVSRGWYFEVVC